MTKARSLWVVLGLLSVSLISVSANAQQNGRVTGLIQDADFNPIPGAAVQLTNAGIGYFQRQTTGADGTFTFLEVPPHAAYVLNVEAQGFEPQISDEFELAVNQPLHWHPPITLAALRPPSPPAQAQPGPAVPASKNTQPSVQVSAPPPQPRRIASSATLLDYSSMMSGVIDSATVHTLPLADRDFLDLALLAPGTYPVEQGSALAGASLVVNGVRASMNNFLLDGADDNDYTINQSLPFQLVEAMQEFRVQTSTSPAEFGRNAGAQINTVSRSGSNSLHGELFEFNRNSALSALNALSLYRGGTFDAFSQEARVNEIINGTSTNFPTPVLSDPVLNPIFQAGRDLPLNQNQFGANLGGPIKRNRAYFFFNWEGFRVANPRPVFERVPDMSARSASACATQDAPKYGFSTCHQPGAMTLANLYPAPNVATSTVKSQVDGLSAPVSNPATGDTSLVGAALLPSGQSAFLPVPQGGSASVVGGAFYVGDSKNSTDSDNFLGRVDVQPTKNASMSFKHNVQEINQTQGGSLPASSDYPGNGIDVNGRNQNFSYNYSQQLSPAAVNVLRFAWNRFRLDTVPLDHSVDPSSVFPYLNSKEIGFPTVLLGGDVWTTGAYASLGAPSNAPDSRADSVWTVADNLSRTTGRHLVEFGFEFRRNRLNVNNDAADRGVVALFDVPYTADAWNAEYVSIARVSQQFGGVNGAGGLDRSFSDNAYDWFGQDAWRPSRNLSINFGLRYEVNTAPVEARNRLVNDYPFASSDCGLFCLMQSGSFSIYDMSGNNVGTSNFQAPRAGFKTDYKDFGPRVGLAWSPGRTGKLVIRAGYALAFDQQSLEPSVNMLLNPPFVQEAGAYYPSLGGTFPLSPVTLPISGYNSPYSITARDPNTRSPYVHQFHFGMERQLGTTGVLGIAYVGSAGHRLPSSRLLLGCTGALLNDLANRSNNDCLSDNDSAVYQENSANSIYHSLQARFDTRSFHGLTVHGSYEWAHAIDDASSSSSPAFIVSPPLASLYALAYTENGYAIDPDQLSALNSVSPTLNLRPELPTLTSSDLLPNDTNNSAANLAGQRGSSDFDLRQRFVISYIYDLPAWHQAGRLGGGWEMAGITTVQTGQPFSVYGDYFGVPLRPNQNGHTVIDNRNPDGAIDGALVAGCNIPGFQCPGTNSESTFNIIPSSQFQAGSLSRNTFIGPGLTSFDFSVLKNTMLTEGKNLQFRVEFFNLFNRANYLKPSSDTGMFEAGYDFPNPFFGEILQARAPREIQFALKFTF